jgi:hypothetical protein
MSLDRKRLHEVRQRALQQLANPEMSQQARDLYKQALDHEEVALGLDSARLRKLAASEPRASPSGSS